MVLVSVALIGLGSAIFHPEASRIARLAAGMRPPGFAQSLFQLGGNAGTALGPPLVAAWIVLPRGQISIEWFAGGIALLAMVVLAGVGRWYVRVGAERATARKSRARDAIPLPPRVVRTGMAMLILLMMSKFIYSVSYSSYYTFYLMERFGLTPGEAQIGLFIFLGAVAVGTIIGGPIGDRIGRRRVIMWSILGILPITVILPWLPLIPNVAMAAVAADAGLRLPPRMVVYAQDLMPMRTGMVAGLLFGLAFGIAAIGAAGLGVLADEWGHRRRLQNLRLPAHAGPSGLLPTRCAAPLGASPHTTPDGLLQTFDTLLNLRIAIRLPSRSGLRCAAPAFSGGGYPIISKR